MHRLSALVADGPAVLSFNRGSWCPFCNEEVGAWSESKDALAAAGGRLIIVTPETGGKMTALAAIAGDGVTVLCDQDMGVALGPGLAFPVGPAVLKLYQDEEFYLADVYGNQSGFLPVPATFLFDHQRAVSVAVVDPDFRHRAEPAGVLQALAGLHRRS